MFRTQHSTGAEPDANHRSTALRSRWAAVGAAVAVTLGAGGIGLVSATNPDGAVAYVPLDAPCRAADTRPGDDNVGDKASPIGPAETHTINSNDGQCDGLVPASATGVQLNVTSLNSTIASFLTIWADGDRPLASSLNPTPGQPPVPNAVTTAITDSGDFNVFNNAGNVDVVVDIVGYYTNHNHDDRYYQKTETYTQTEVDSAVAERVAVGSEIVLSQGTADLVKNTNTGGALTISPFATGARLTDSGSVQIDLNGVASLGGAEYRLSSVEYCIRKPASPSDGFINSVTVYPHDSSFFSTLLVSDGTDRSTSGCYSIDVPAATTQGYMFLLNKGGTGPLTVSGLQTTWVEVVPT